MDDIIHQVFALGRIQPQGVQFLGTCFTVATDGRLATANHVLGNNAQNLVIALPKINSFNDYQDTTNNRFEVLPVDIVEVDPTRDIAILKIRDASTKITPIGSLDEIKTGENLEIYGFPHCPDGRNVLTFQVTTLGAKILLESSSIKSKHAVLNVQARPGQSGSMVLSRETGRISGILIGAYAPGGGAILIGNVNPSAIHQTTHVISAHYIRDML
ncbi:serine protease [Pseudomonas sp. P108]|uniref:S1 family peptidase n=1 Tax=Pseudomonas sp. P108 TaxID=1837993 RepID=UPI0029347185|nr:serine protease [Pseudomonas sp. P108]WNZ81905.1 serine protease [Pseudomonas sp. P108]